MDMKSSSYLIVLLNVVLTLCSGAYASELPKPLGLETQIPKKPEITEQPKSCVKMEGANARLYCGTAGYPTPKVSWLLNNEPLTNHFQRSLVKSGDGGLIFIRVQNKEDWPNTGTYQCIARNNVGVAYSNNATVGIATIDDDFRKEPTDKIAEVGKAATIECEGPRGVPEPNITWKKDSWLVLTDNRVQVLSSGNLHFERLQLSDSGSYECVATNIAGTKTSTAAVLMVQEPPHVSVSPSTKVVQSGQNVEVSCYVEGNPKARTRWSRKTGSVPNRFTTTSTGSMTINNIEEGDSGEYVCTAKNRVGEHSASVTITVQVKPKIVEAIPETTVQVGETLSLPCRAKGNPLPTIFWRDPQGNEMFVAKSYQDGHILIDTNGDLLIFSVQLEDEGLYRCQALNILGTAMEDVRLNVRSSLSHGPPPKLDHVPVNTTAQLGTTITLQCSSTNIPSPDINWMKEGKPVPTNHNRHRITKLSSGSLQITNLQESDSGQYSCRASNNYGITEWRAWITVGEDSARFMELPAAPGKPVFVNSSSTSITISWTSKQIPPPNYYVIEYYRTGISPNSWKRIVPVSQILLKVENLLPSSDYVFAIRSVNRRGVSTPSPNSAVMKTKDPSISPPSNGEKSLHSVSVRLLRAEAFDDESMTLTWESSDGCGVIDSFLINLQATSSYSKQGKRSQHIHCSRRSAKINTLSRGEKYEVAIQPLKDFVAGRASPIVFVSLSKGLILPSPPVLTSKVEDNVVIFEWMLPSDLPATFVAGYEVFYGPEGGAPTKGIRVNSTVTKVTVNDLTPDVNYVATVTYLTRLGRGITSNQEKVMVEEALENESDIIAFFKQPAFLVALAVGLLLIIISIIAGVCWFKRSKRSCKTGSFHSTRRGDMNSFGGSYPLPSQHQTEPNPRNLISNENNFIMERVPMIPTSKPTNPNNNASVSYNTKYDNKLSSEFSRAKRSGEVTSNIKKPVGFTHSNPTSFSYVNDQLTSKNDIQPQFSSPSVSSPQPMVFPPQRQPIHYDRQHDSNSTDDVIHYIDSSNTPAAEVFPPPPSPPLSHKTEKSDKSRSSSGVRSTSDRSTRSGQSSRLPLLPNGMHNTRPPPVVEASSRLHGSQPQQPFEHSYLEQSHFTPPTPPIRGESIHEYEPSSHYNPSRDPHLNGKLEQEGVQKLCSSANYSCNFNHQRNNVAGANVSWGNGYGSESDVRESSCEHESSSYTSDEDSVDVDESVSQVGQNRLHPISEVSSYMPPPQQAKPQPPMQYYTDQDPLLSETSGQTSPLETSTCSQLNGIAPVPNNQHGVSSTTQNQSLNSNSSSGSSRSGGNSRKSRSRLHDPSKRNPTSQAQSRSPNEAPASLKLEISNALNGLRSQNQDCPSPSSPTESAVSELSGYVSTASSCWQFQLPSPNKTGSQLRNANNMNNNGRIPTSVQRPADGRVHHPYINTKPESYFPNRSRNISNPNYDSAPNNFNNGLSQFQNARLGLANKVTHTYPPERLDNKATPCPANPRQEIDTRN